MITGYTGMAYWITAGEDFKAGDKVYQFRNGKGYRHRRFVRLLIGYAGSDVKKGELFSPVYEWTLQVK